MRFSDLVAFIETQVRILSDPLYGNIQDLPSTNYKASNAGHLKQRKKGSSFATNVTAVKEGVITQYTGNKTKSFTTHSCLYCSHSNYSQFKVKVHRDKINFIKEKGMFWLPESRPHKQRLQELFGLQRVSPKAPRSSSY